MDTPVNPALPDFVDQLALLPALAPGPNGTAKCCPWSVGASSGALLRQDVSGHQRAQLVKRAVMAAAATAPTAGPQLRFAQMLGLLDVFPLSKVRRGQ